MAPLIQLTKLGAVLPYGICVDSQNCIWVAAKGGLFRFDEESGKCTFAEKHDKPKSMNAFSVVDCCVDANGDDVIFTKFSEVNVDETHLVLYDKDGERKATNIADGSVKSASMTTDGEIFLTMRKKQDLVNSILKTNVDDFYTFNSIATSTDMDFQHIVASAKYDLLAVSVAKMPVNPYSNNEIHVYRLSDGQFLRKFGEETSKEAGKLWHPRALQFDDDGNLLILDKTGRIQKFAFNTDEFLGEIAQMPAGLTNGFCLNPRRTSVYITCSGFVEDTFNDEEGVYCNDWIETLPISK